MSFTNYLEDENDKPYFTQNSLAYYYDKMEGFAKAVEGSAKALNLTKEEIEQRIALRLAEWDKNLETFDGSVEKLLSEWVDDGTLTHVIDSTLIDVKLTETKKNISSIRDFGAKIDGLADDSGAFHTAFNSGDNVKIFIPEGKIAISELKIPVDKNVTIEGAGIGLTVVNSLGRFFYTSNLPKFTTSPSLPFKEGDRTVILASVTGCEIGQLITFTSTQNMQETVRITPRTHSAIITAINGFTVTIDRSFPYDFSLSGYSISVKGYKTGKLTIKNMTVIGEFNGYSGDVTNTAGFTLENVKMINRNKKYQGETATGGFNPALTGGTMHGFRVQYAVDSTFINPVFEYLSYGVLCGIGSVSTTILNPKAVRCRHTVTPTGGSQGVTTRDGKAYECFAGYDSHECAIDSSFYNCQSYGDEIENKFRGRNDLIDGCYFAGGIVTKHDEGLRGIGIKDKYKKTILNTVTDKHIIADQSINVKMDNVTAKNFISNYQVMESFILENSSIFMDSPVPGANTGLWLGFAKINSYRNLRVYGPYRGINQSDGILSTLLHRAFRVDRNDQGGTVMVSNVEIDGFDYGIDFPMAMSLEKFTFDNIQFKNCVHGINNGTNTKTNPTFKNLFFDNCKTNIVDSFRFTYTRPLNPYNGQLYIDPITGKILYFHSATSMWKDALGITV